MPSLSNASDLDVNRARLIDTARRLIEVPSRTGEAGAVSDRLAEILQADGFKVKRPAAGYPQSPAVVVRLESGRPGPTLQFDGHLDTVHLPFVPPAVDGGRLTGSGASDMKAGVAAAVEAVRALRDAGGLVAGSVLLTAHDLHEAPWGDGRQLDRMIREGIHGDAVLLPEPIRDVLPIAGRGRRHLESRRPPTLDRRSTRSCVRTMSPACWPPAPFWSNDWCGSTAIWPAHPTRSVARPACSSASSTAVRSTTSILNRPGSKGPAAGYQGPIPGPSNATSVRGSPIWPLTRGQPSIANGCLSVTLLRSIRPTHWWPRFSVAIWRPQAAQPLPIGPKPFVDDGNSFYANAGVPSITHGPRAGGQHTVSEWVEIDDLVRVAWLYAAVAAEYCQMGTPPP